jgi:hypothetical protein
MRSLSVLAFAAVFVLTACGGAAPAASQAVTPTQPASGAPQSTPAGAPVPPGSGTVSVTLMGGPDAGTYMGGENPNCSNGLIGEGAWGVQYSTDAAGAGQLSSLQLIAPPSGEVAMDVTFQMTVTIGELFEGNDYEVKMTEGDSSGTGSAEVSDAGSTAVIHATGTTADGVGIDATVNCPSVIRA